MAAPLRVAPTPASEPIVLTIEGATHVVSPGDEAWPIAYYAREKGVQLQLAERDLRGKRALISQLREDKAAKEAHERATHPERETIERVFDRWRVESGRTRCKLTPERFDMTAARLGEGYFEADLTMAAIGVAVNPYVIRGERQGDYRTAMQSGEAVERYANRCPPELRRQVSGRLFE